MTKNFFVLTIRAVSPIEFRPSKIHEEAYKGPRRFKDGEEVKTLGLYTRSLPIGTPTEFFMPVQDKRRDPYVVRPIILVKERSIILRATQGKGELKTHDIIYQSFERNGIEAVYKHEGEYYKGVIYPAKPEKENK